MKQISYPENDNQEILEKKSYPVDLLRELAEKQTTGCLKVKYNDINYLIYFNSGKIAYATNSLDPFERLERHLRRLSHSIPILKGEIRRAIGLKFNIETEKAETNPQDYQAINWLVEQEHLTEEQATNLAKNIIEEVLETYLLLPQDLEKYFDKNINLGSTLGVIDLTILLDKIQKNLRIWYKLHNYINSSYQRPYFFSKPGSKPEHQKIGKLLRGFSFRQLAAMLDRDEVTLAKRFYPLIVNKSIIIRDPSPPFDRLPKMSKDSVMVATRTSTTQETKSEISEDNLSDLSGESVQTKQWKIVCIDDSPTILKEISRFLDRSEFKVVPITQPLKALMKIIRVQPDLILLDVGMPNIDGYKLCTLVRKYSAFKNTPIVMVTGNKGLIDRAKARMAGATDYMTKPFTQDDLLNMVFRYLS